MNCQIYQRVFRPILFRIDPETVHNRMTRLGNLMGRSFVTRAIIRAMFYYKNPALQTTVAGIEFDNPLGLSAGFDKNAQLYNILPEVGFGFAELGSITGEPCAGNPKPRLFRIPQEKSIIVNYGLCSKGSEVISKQLSDVKFRMPIGLSIAKTNDQSIKTTEDGIKDYIKAYRNMHPLGSYTTINVSCPNTSDGQTFGHPENLEPLLKIIGRESHLKPIFLKIKPDFNKQKLNEIVQIAEKHKWLTGFIISNLTMNREGLKTPKEEIDKISLKGGLSGLPVQKKSNEAIKLVHKNSPKVIIGCGGIFNGKDAYEKLKLGASLLQMVTGLIYEGQGVVSSINKELVELMAADGYKNISEIKK